MKKKVYVIFSVICVTIFVLFVVFNFVIFPSKYKNQVVYFSNKYNLEIALVYAVIKAESNFDEKAQSSSGARGLMQILPSTAKWIAGELGVEYADEILFDKNINIEFGCFYLSYLFSKFATKDVVVCAYNAGETVVRTWLDENGYLDESKIAYSETKNYYKRVMGFYNVYKTKEISI